MTASERLAVALDVLVMAGRRTPCATDTALWFGSPADRVEAAARCQWCPLLEVCGDAADENGESAGVWAGVDREARRPRGRRRVADVLEVAS